MKKIKMTIAAVMFCAAAFAGYNAYEQATMTDQERLMLANIEALTNDDEIIDGGEIPEIVITCDGGGSGKCYKMVVQSIPFSDECYADCDFTGMQDDYCSAFLTIITNCLLH